MKLFTAIAGQSIYDVCLNTYGSFDLLIKLIQENSFPNLNTYPASGQIFIFDDSLILDPSLLNKVKYSTSLDNNGRINFLITGDGNSDGIGNIFGTGGDQVKYEKIIAEQYTSGSDGVTTISLPTLIGWDIIQVTKEIKPLKFLQYSWNISTGILTLIGTSLDTDETLFIIAGKIITE